MAKKEKLLLIVVCFAISMNSLGQITTEELPMSEQLKSSMQNFDAQLLSARNSIIELETPDMAAIYAEDEINDRNPEKYYRVGIRIPVAFNTKEDGTWTILPNGGKMWQLTVSAKNAQSLDLSFSKFWLPENTKFFIYNPNTLETIGAITSTYLRGSKESPSRFSTGIVAGDTLTLEYYQPSGVVDDPVIEVSGVYYGYRTVSALYTRSGFGASGDCQVDVNCSEGSNWQNEKKAITRILGKTENDSRFFTGALMMNTGLDFKPYVLTANHCLGPFHQDAYINNDASEFIFYWGYEAPECGSSVSPYLKCTYGADLVANNDITDFALYRLQQNPRFLTGFTPYYLGWDVTGQSFAGGVCIHHPSGDIKKISTYNCAPTSAYFLDGSYYNYMNHWKVTWVSLTPGRHGTTEHCSSGSPLIASNRKVIGVLHGGYSSCDSLYAPDWFGKISESWTGGGYMTYPRRLGYWLDPSDTGQQTIDGSYYSSFQIVGQTNPCGSEVYYIDDLPVGYYVMWSFQNGSSGLPYTISQNTPEFGQCTVNIPSGQAINEILVANIMINGHIAATRTKQIFNTHTVGGAYSQEAGSLTPAISTTVFSGSQPILIYPDAFATIMSGALVNKTVLYTGTNLSYWNYNSASGIITLKFPASQDTQAITIFAQESNSCVKSTIDVQTIATVNETNSDISVYMTQNEIQLTVLNRQDKISQKNYNVEIVDFSNGIPIYDRVLKGNQMSINTTGWKPGVYILICEVDGKKISRKIVIK